MTTHWTRLLGRQVTATQAMEQYAHEAVGISLWQWIQRTVVECFGTGISREECEEAARSLRHEAEREAEHV